MSTEQEVTPSQETPVATDAEAVAETTANKAPDRPTPTRKPATPRARRAPAAKAAATEIAPAGVATVTDSGAAEPAVDTAAPAPDAPVAEAAADGMPPAASEVRAADLPVPTKGKKAKAEKLKAEKPKKLEKVIRDSFSLPKSEANALKELRESLAREGRICTKSELLRAGLAMLLKEPAQATIALIAQLPVPPKGKRAKK